MTYFVFACLYICIFVFPGPQEISWSLGMYNPIIIHPSAVCNTKTTKDQKIKRIPFVLLPGVEVCSISLSETKPEAAERRNSPSQLRPLFEINCYWLIVCFVSCQITFLLCFGVFWLLAFMFIFG